MFNKDEINHKVLKSKGPNIVTKLQPSKRKHDYLQSDLPVEPLHKRVIRKPLELSEVVNLVSDDNDETVVDPAFRSTSDPSKIPAWFEALYSSKTLFGLKILL